MEGGGQTIAANGVVNSASEGHRPSRPRPQFDSIKEKQVTNAEWGKAVGCSHSMASRLRRGKRLPSVALLGRIAKEFDIPEGELLRAHGRGPESFARVLKKYDRPVAKVAA